MRAAAALALVALAGAGCGAGSSSGSADPALRAAPRVVTVRVPAAIAGLGSTATAFAVGGRRAVTVAHVLGAARSVRVHRRRARVKRIDRRLDVAVLRLARPARPAARLASARAGERVTVRVIRAGRARSLPATVRRPITARVHGADGRVRVRPALELAASVLPGDSGTPVLDGRGRVVGMVFAQASGRDGVAYALDARALGPLLAR